MAYQPARTRSRLFDSTVPELTSSLPAAHFERIYEAAADPWQSLTRDSQQRKFRISLAVLPRETYGVALEVGCGIGALSRGLAPRCERLCAIDCSRTAVEQARALVPDDHVEFSVARVPEEFPAGRFDLVVLSEVGYYLTAHELAELYIRVEGALTAGGHVLLVHWLGDSKDHRRTALEVHDAFTGPAWARSIGTTVVEAASSYRIDVVEKR